MTVVASQSEERELEMRGPEASTPPSASHSPHRTILFSARTETCRDRGEREVSAVWVEVATVEDRVTVGVGAPAARATAVGLLLG